MLIQVRSRSITYSLRWCVFKEIWHLLLWLCFFLASAHHTILPYCSASMLVLALSNLHPVCNAPIVIPQRKPMKEETLTPSEHHATTLFRGEETLTYLYIRMDWVTIWYSWRVKLQRAWLVVTSTLAFSGTTRIVESCTRCNRVLGGNDGESWHNDVVQHALMICCLIMFFTVNTYTSSTIVTIISIQAPRQRERIACSPFNSFPLDNVSNDLLHLRNETRK